MLFIKRFDNDSKNFWNDLKQTFKLQNQKNFIKNVKTIIANLITNDVKQIERILIEWSRREKIHSISFKILFHIEMEWRISHSLG